MRKKKVVLLEKIGPTGQFDSWMTFTNIEEAEAELKKPETEEGEYRIITVNRTATIGSETVRKVQID